jgi:ribonuclease HI
MGWGSGFRVYLGSSIGDEKRVVTVYSGGEITSTTAQIRTVTQERAEYRGLSKALAATKIPTSGWTIISRDRKDESGQWVVVEELITYGAWAADT